MMSIRPDNPTGLLDRAQGLYRERRFGAVLNLLEAEDGEASIRTEPELAILVVSSLDHQFRFSDATAAIKRFGRLILLSGNECLIRRWRNLHAGQLIRMGRLTEAGDLLTSTLSRAEEVYDSRAAIIAANGLGIIASIRGHVDDALRFYGRAIHAALQKGDSINVGRSRYNMAVVLREWGHLEASEQNFSLASDYFERQGTIYEVVFLAAERSLLHLMRGDRLLADSLSDFSLRRARIIRNPFLLANSLKCRATVLVEKGFPAMAENLLHEAEGVLGATGDPLIRAEILEELAVVSLLQGSGHSGHREEAERIYVRLGAPRQVERMRHRIVATAADPAGDAGRGPIGLGNGGS